MRQQRPHLRDDVRPVTELRAQFELRRDIHTAEGQLADGRGVSHEAARAEVLSVLRP